MDDRGDERWGIIAVVIDVEDGEANGDMAIMDEAEDDGDDDDRGLMGVCGEWESEAGDGGRRFGVDDDGVFVSMPSLSRRSRARRFWNQILTWIKKKEENRTH